MQKTKAWILAARPKTLVAAAAPVIIASAIALGDKLFKFWPALAALLGALLIQIGTNFVNDLYDFKKGSDTAERQGPVRVTQAGLLTPKQVMKGIYFVFGLAVIIGFYLLINGGWPIFFIGILSIAAGVAYTAGPFPLGYNGLGDIVVFIFFGFVAVGGTYFVQTATLTPQIFWAAIAVGALATAILIVNNIRDIEQDRKSGKKTLAVRFGKKFSISEYIFLLALAYITAIIIWLLGLTSSWIFIVFLSLPLSLSLIKDIINKEGQALNKTLAKTGKLELIYSLLFSLGYLLGS